MIRPFLADDAFLKDVAAAREEPGSLHLWWLGQSGFLILWQGRSLLLDPYLSDSLTRKYAATDKPHVRMSERVIDPARLNFIDVVTSSHNHTDHLDADTLIPLIRANPDIKLIIPEANRAFVADRLKIDPAMPIGLDAGESEAAAGFVFHAVPAAHESVERDEAGRCKFVGYVVEIGPFKLYHSGDTLLYEGMADRLRHFEVDIALLPINGRAPERRVAGNLDGIEAARLAHEIGARLVIPCHYDMFEFNTADPGAFARTCEDIQQPYRVLRAGERLSIPPGKGDVQQ